MNRFAVYTGFVLLLLLVCFAESRQITGKTNKLEARDDVILENNLRVRRDTDTENELIRNRRLEPVTTVIIVCGVAIVVVYLGKKILDAGKRIIEKYEKKIDDAAGNKKRSLPDFGLSISRGKRAAESCVINDAKGDPAFSCQDANGQASKFDTKVNGDHTIYDVKMVGDVCNFKSVVTIYQPDPVNHPGHSNIESMRVEVDGTEFLFDTRNLTKIEVDGQEINLTADPYLTADYGAVAIENQTIVLLFKCNLILRAYLDEKNHGGVNLFAAIDKGNVVSDNGQCSV